MNRSRTLALVPWLLLLACGADFKPGSEIDSLRVLAVQADLPFAHPGDTVHLQALSYDPPSRPLEWAWAVCPEPASSSVQDCLAQIAADAATGNPLLLGSGAGQDRAVLPIPADVLDGVPEGARTQALVGVLSVACPGHIEMAAIEPSASDPGTASTELPFRCIDADGGGAELGLHDSVFGIKRVFLRETESNQNPVIDQILFDGEPWDESDIKQVDGCDSDGLDYDACKPSAHRIAAVV
ncbi:MAG TPA: hypothetical protein VG963_05620, partial [Polyangiaceae bacterium]|nr:hypothetical protein [Polyangiaceae bacterium]